MRTYHLAMLIKVVSFGVMLYAVCSAKPPIHGQSFQQSRAITAEDARQDSDIQHEQSDIATHGVAITSIQSIIEKQGEELARLDTKVSFLFGILATLQGGGIAVSIYQKKRVN